MAIRLGQNTWWNFYPLTTYGTLAVAQSNVPFMWHLTLNMKNVHSPIDRPVKSGTITPTSCDQVWGFKLGLVTLTGACTQQALATLLPSYLQSPGATGSFGSTVKSFTIALYATDNTTKCRLAYGCVVKSILISHTVKDKVNLSVTFVAKNISDWIVRPSMTGVGAHYSTYTCTDPTLASTLTCDMIGIDTNQSSFTLTLDTLFIQDLVRYAGGALNPTNQNATNKTAMLSATVLTDTGDGAYLVSVGAELTSAANIIVSDFQININGILSNYELADPDKGTWMNSFLITGKKTHVGKMLTIELI